jgi:predicted PurR-regulated permease PerM
MKKYILFPTFVSGLFLVFLVVSFTFLGPTFLPVYIALLLAYFLEPAVTFLERKGFGRPVSIALVFFAMVLILALLAVFFVYSIKNEFQSVQINLPDYANRFYDLIPRSVKEYMGIETPEKAYQMIESRLQGLQGISADLLSETFTIVKQAFASTLAFILAMVGYFVIPVYLFYFLKDLHGMESGIIGLVPERFREAFKCKASEINDLLSAFVRGQLILVAILSILYSIGLYFIGIDLAVAIGTLAGVAFIIPYLGTILGIVLSVIMAVLKFHDLLHPTLCLGWFGLVQLIEGSLITPKIVGDKVGLHPVVTILSLLIGGQLLGIIGMLFAVPVAAILKVLIRSLVARYRQSEYYNGDESNTASVD